MQGGAGRAYAISAVGGVILWSATAFFGGRAEPWDTGLYWTVSYPLALLMATALGYFFPHWPWRWALIVIFSQLLVLFASGSGLGLLPLGLFLLGALSLPAVALARFGASARARAG